MRDFFRSLLFASLIAAAISTQAASSFSLREQKVSAPEMGEVLTCVLGIGANEFTFVPPYQWRVGGDPARARVILNSSDRTATIMISFGAVNPALAEKAEPDELRRQILRRFTKARIIEEFPCYTSSHSGRAFDVMWTGPGDVPMGTRIALFPTESGSIEFTLSTRAAGLKGGARVLGGLLTSFQKRETLAEGK